jgi:hypothetical protein
LFLVYAGSTSWRGLICEKVCEPWTHIPRPRDVVRRDEAQGVQGPLGRFRFLRVLNEGQPAQALDGPETEAAIVEAAAEEDADHPRFVGFAGRAEQDINRWTGMVFFRALRKVQVVIDDQQVVIGWGDEDRPWLEGFPMLGVAGWEWAGVAEKLGQGAGNKKYHCRIRRAISLQERRDLVF